MSYCTWHNYGIGFNIDDGLFINDDKLIAAIDGSHLMDKYDETFKEVYEECDKDINEACIEIDEYGLGMASVIARIIEERNPGLYLCACDDYNGNQYVMYQASYPWDMSDFDKTLTKEKITDIFEEFINSITDTPIDRSIIGDCEVENGG